MTEGAKEHGGNCEGAFPLLSRPGHFNDGGSKAYASTGTHTLTHTHSSIPAAAP